MSIHGLFGAVHVSDLGISTRFYSRLLGRAPDDQPIDVLVQWLGFGNAGVQLFLDKAKAGGGVMTLVVVDLGSAGARLSASGIALGEIQEGHFGKVAHLMDPDGNTIYLVEPPPRPGA